MKKEIRPTPALPDREGADPTPAIPPVGGEGEISSALGAGGAVHGLHTANVRIYELLKERARSMRTNPTKAEKVLWRALRGNRTGTYFRRQHVLGNFIVDFVSLDRRLVIEVDGDIHDHQQDYDALRTQWLNQTSFHVLRFRNEEVLLHLNSVLERIETIIQQRPSIVAL